MESPWQSPPGTMLDPTIITRIKHTNADLISVRLLRQQMFFLIEIIVETVIVPWGRYVNLSAARDPEAGNFDGRINLRARTLEQAMDINRLS